MQALIGRLHGIAARTAPVFGDRLQVTISCLACCYTFLGKATLLRRRELVHHLPPLIGFCAPDMRQLQKGGAGVYLQITSVLSAWVQVTCGALQRGA